MLENNTFIQIIKMLDLKRSSLKVQVWGKNGHADRDVNLGQKTKTKTNVRTKSPSYRCFRSDLNILCINLHMQM